MPIKPKTRLKVRKTRQQQHEYQFYLKKKHCIIIITWSPSLFKDSGLGSVEEVSIGSIFKPPPGPPGSHTAGVPTCKKRWVQWKRSSQWRVVFAFMKKWWKNWPKVPLALVTFWTCWPDHSSVEKSCNCNVDDKIHTKEKGGQGVHTLICTCVVICAAIFFPHFLW